MSADGKQDGGFLREVWFTGQEGDVAIGVLTMDDFGADRASDAQALESCRHPAIGSDFDLSADTPDVGPPRATGCRAQNVLLFLLRLPGGGIWGASDFPVDFLGVTMVPERG